MADSTNKLTSRGGLSGYRIVNRVRDNQRNEDGLESADQELNVRPCHVMQDDRNNAVKDQQPEAARL